MISKQNPTNARCAPQAHTNAKEFAQADLVKKVECCARAINDDTTIKLCVQDANLSTNELGSLVGLAAGLLWVLPLEEAKTRYNRQRKLDRAIQTFKSAVEAYEFESERSIPWPSDVLYKYLATDTTDAVLRSLPDLAAKDYLQLLSDDLRDSNGGLWVHPMLETTAGRWPSTTDSAAEVWIIRTLDNVGVSRNTTAEQAIFLNLGVRLAELLDGYSPNGITTDRKKLRNHAEFQGAGKMRWRTG
jgi:hypothetical protein